MRFTLNLLITFFLLFSAVGLQHSRLLLSKQGERVIEENSAALRQSTEEERLLALNMLPVFGFDNLFANGVYLAFLQYFGNKNARQSEGYGLSPLYFDALIERDPQFIDAYLYLSNTLSLRLAQAERSIELMEKGLASLTPTTPRRSYFIWRYKAIDELLFLGDGEAAKQSFEKAAEWARQSSDEEAPLIAEISSQTAEFLATNPVSRSAQISAWAQVLVSARDEETQQIATKKIEALGGTVVVNEGGQVSVNFNIYDE